MTVERASAEGEVVADEPADERASPDAEVSETATPSKTGGTGLDPNVAAALAYVFSPISGVVLYLLDGERDEFVRFHSLQSIGYGVAVVGAYVLLSVVIGVVTFLPVIGGAFGLLLGLLYPVVALAAFAGWAFLIYKAYEGERVSLPVIGSFAASR
ncbi:MAG: DUF4870 domain-containing protein [Halosimplex sp.]